MATGSTKTRWWATKPAIAVGAAIVGFGAGVGSGGEATEPATPAPLVSMVTATAAPVTMTATATATTTATATATTTTTTTVSAPPETVTATATVTAQPLVAVPTAEPKADAYYENCDAARAAGAAPVRRGDPGYRSGLDRNGDGVGCE